MLIEKEHGPVTGFRLATPILGRPFYFTAAYYVDGLLIDSGCAHTAPDMVRSMAGRPLHTVACTHCHEDHVGGNAALARAHGCRVLAPAEELGALLLGRGKLPLKPYQRFMWGFPEPHQAAPLPELLETDNHRFQVIPTPGHSPGHRCFLEPEMGWFFCGDAFIGGRDRALREDYEIWQIINSLKKMATLPIKTLYAGSGTVYKDPLPAIREKITYLEELGEKVLLLATKGLPARAISRRLLGKKPLISYITLGHFSGLQLVRSYLRKES